MDFILKFYMGLLFLVIIIIKYISYPFIQFHFFSNTHFSLLLYYKRHWRTTRHRKLALLHTHTSVKLHCTGEKFIEFILDSEKIGRGRMASWFITVHGKKGKWKMKNYVDIGIFMSLLMIAIFSKEMLIQMRNCFCGRRFNYCCAPKTCCRDCFFKFLWCMVHLSD